MIYFKDINLTLNNKNLFNNFNLVIKKHEKVLLNAPSGSGKTSLMKLALGFLKPDSGEIYIDGDEIKPNTLKQIRSKIAYVSQDVDFHNVEVHRLISDTLSFKVNSDLKVDDYEIKDLLSYFNMDNTKNKMVDQLSGGERQRLGFIIAILLKRPIFLLDEVTSGLDKEMKEKVIKYILDLEQTVIIISHDPFFKKQKQIRIVEW